jgi:hypothetical protein
MKNLLCFCAGGVASIVLLDNGLNETFLLIVLLTAILISGILWLMYEKKED